MTWLHISSGRGPEECNIAVKGILNIIINEAKNKNIEYELLEFEESDSGLFSALLSVGDDNFAKSWTGPIKWICKSPVRKNWPRKNWFISISMIKEPEKTNITINEKDIIFSHMRSQGPGGQNVNKTSSAIRLEHIPTGIIIKTQEERSQHQNKRLALAKLYMILEDANIEKEKTFEKFLWTHHNNIMRGNPIKVFSGIEFNEVKG